MKEIDMLKNNEFIDSFIKENNISEDYIKDNLNMFLRIHESLEKCAGCKSIEECRQDTPGQKLTLDYQGIPVEVVEFCGYAQKNIDDNELAEKYVYCDIPDNLMDIDLDNIQYTEDQKQLYALLLEILHKKNKKGLYIYGNLGVGKTYLCVALANSLVKKGEKVGFVKVTDFFSDMKANIVSNNALVDKTVNRLKKVDYLFFDDIGAETVSQFVRDDILFRILDYRMPKNLTTIFTSNLDKEALYKHYQYDRNEKSKIMNAERLLERIDILSDDYVLEGRNLRRYKNA